MVKQIIFFTELYFEQVHILDIMPTQSITMDSCFHHRIFLSYMAYSDSTYHFRFLKIPSFNSNEV